MNIKFDIYNLTLIEKSYFKLKKDKICISRFKNTQQAIFKIVSGAQIQIQIEIVRQLQWQEQQ